MGEACGWPGSASRSFMIGSNVSPKAWNDASDSHTSNTWIRPSASIATWYSLPGGAPAPASSSRLSVSSYRVGVNELGVKYIPSAISAVPLNISRFSSQATLPAPDRGLGQILAKYSPDGKLSANLRSVLDVMILPAE